MTSVTYGVAPNYSRLASTQSIANPTLPSSGGGTLCAGWNVAQTQIATPLNPGDYNLQKVALSNAAGSVYEIECYQNAGTGVASQDIGFVPSLDHCVDRCTSAGPGICQVAYYRKDISTCQFYSTQQNLTPNPMVFNVQTARLITSSTSQVVDAAYLLPASSAYNLGLCAGPSSNNYDKSFVTVYNQTNTLRGFLTSRLDTFRVDCGGRTFFSGIAASRQDHIAAAARFSMTPQTADDCARLCNWQSVYAGDGASNGCRFWHWLVTGVCEIYSSRPGFSQTLQVAVNSTVLAAGISRASNGQEWDPANVSKYKRSLDLFREEDTSPVQRRKGKRGVKHARNPQPAPVLDEEPESLVPHVVIPFRRHT